MSIANVLRLNHQYSILPDTILRRLLFATSVLHAYGHQWACQLIYNPRFRNGLGLTEGEGTERTWSRFCKLIGVTRSSGVCFSCLLWSLALLLLSDSARAIFRSSTAMRIPLMVSHGRTSGPGFEDD